jgi:hypothetical protein
MKGLAEGVEFIKHMNGLGKLHVFAAAPVIAMAAVEIAGLGQVPLESKGEHPRLLGAAQRARQPAAECAAGIMLECRAGAIEGEKEPPA